jgi:cell division protein FtsB
VSVLGNQCGGILKQRLDGGSASNQSLLERLEAENAQLRRSVVELVLQIQVLRDDARALTA